MPNLSVVAFLKSIELAIICSTVCINLGLLISKQDASHSPFTVDKTTVANLKVLIIEAARAANLEHLFSYWENSIALVDYYKLLKGCTLRVVTVAQPRKAIRDFSEPRSIIFPIYFLDILNCIKGEVDAQGDLETWIVCLYTIYTSSVRKSCWVNALVKERCLLSSFICLTNVEHKRRDLGR